METTKGFPHDCPSSLSLSLLTLASTAALASPTPVPFTEHFGTGYSSSGCASQWDGKCENGWVAFGENDSLALETGPGGDVVLSITPHPGTVNGNGFTRRFAVTPGQHIEAGAEVIAVGANGGKAEVSIQMKFRRANGSLISTKLATFTITNEHTISMTEVVPAQAATVDVATGANNSTYQSLRPKIPIWWLLVPGHQGQKCEEPECPPCNISCGAGKIPVDRCESEGFPQCYTIDTCYCGDQGDFESDNQAENLYGPF